MKKAGIVLLFFFLLEFALISLSTVIDLGVLHVCIWSDIDNEISWKMIRIIQIITIPIVGVMFLVSLFCKAWKIDLAEKSSDTMRNRIVAYFRIWRYVLFSLMFLSVLRDYYAGHPLDEFELSRAHVFLLCLNNIFMALTGYNIGYKEIVRKR